MNEKELIKLRSDILKEQKKVASSKKAATEYLIQLGILDKNGSVKKEFRHLQS